MTDIFISFARSMEASADRIKAALKDAGYPVWSDADLPANLDYADVIEEKLRSARAVVVLWSADAVRSQWVRAEADLARGCGTIVQVMLDATPLPLPFNRLQFVDLQGWSGDTNAPGWRKLLANISRLFDAHAATAQLAAQLDFPTQILPEKPSIAVLPFTDISARQQQEYFADAITEDIITALSRWRWFFVIARNSSFAYKERRAELHEIASALGVRYIVEGSVRKIGRRVRVTAQLVDAATGIHLWGSNFDSELVNILTVQDRIVENIVQSIEPTVFSNESARIMRKPLADYTAFDCYQRGMWHLNQVTREHSTQAAALFREAIARDPELALGHIGLSRILYGAATVYGWSNDHDADLLESHRAAHTAIGLDPSDANGYFALSGAALYLGRHGEALAAALKAVELNPNLAYVQFRLAQVLIYAGRPADAVQPMLQSLGCSPIDPQLGAMRGTLALAYYQSRNYAAAVIEAREAKTNGFAAGQALLAASLAKLGRLDEARAALPAESLARVLKATARLATYVNDSDRDHLLEGLMLTGVAAVPIPGSIGPSDA